MRLSEFQDSFKDTMLQPVSGLDAVDADLRGVFVDDHIGVEERLKVYHNNIIGSLSESLRGTYPVVETLVGEDFMKSMARAFVFDNPSPSGCLYFYGRGFDDFIRGFAPAAGLPYLADVAALEWAEHEAYYAQDDEALAGDYFAQMSEDGLLDAVLSLRSSATLIESDYPLLAVKAFCADEDGHDAPDLTRAHEERLLIYRRALEVEIVSLDKGEFFLLKQLDNGIALGLAVERTLDKYPEFDFTDFLKKHISLETFSSVAAN